MAAALHENVNYDGIAFCFQKHPVNSMAWLSSLLNTYYGKTISVAKYENLFTTNAKDTLKADALTLLNEWVLNEAQIVSDHAVGSAEDKTMKNLLKMEKTPLVTLYGTGDWE